MIKQPRAAKAPHYSRTGGLLQLESSFNWSFSNLAAMLRMNLLIYRAFGPGWTSHSKNRA